MTFPNPLSHNLVSGLIWTLQVKYVSLLSSKTLRISSGVADLGNPCKWRV